MPRLSSLFLLAQFDDSVLEHNLLILQLLDLALLLRLSMLRLKLFTHRKCRRGLIKRLICRDSHLDLISDTQKEETSLRLVDGHLTYYFFEALLEQFLSDRAYAGLACLPLGQLLVQEPPQTGNVQASGLPVRDMSDAVFSTLDPLFGRENRVQNVLGSRLLLHGRQLCLLGARSREGFLERLQLAQVELNCVLILN